MQQVPCFLKACQVLHRLLQGTVLLVLWRHLVLHLVQERAYVTGLRAANLVVDHLGSGMHANILPVEPDEPYIAALKGTAKSIKSGLEALGIRSPFL